MRLIISQYYLPLPPPLMTYIHSPVGIQCSRWRPSIHCQVLCLQHAVHCHVLRCLHYCLWFALCEISAVCLEARKLYKQLTLLSRPYAWQLCRFNKSCSNFQVFVWEGQTSSSQKCRKAIYLFLVTSYLGPSYQYFVSCCNFYSTFRRVYM